MQTFIYMYACIFLYMSLSLYAYIHIYMVLVFTCCLPCVGVQLLSLCERSVQAASCLGSYPTVSLVYRRAKRVFSLLAFWKGHGIFEPCFMKFRYKVSDSNYLYSMIFIEHIYKVYGFNNMVMNDCKICIQYMISLICSWCLLNNMCNVLEFIYIFRIFIDEWL